VPLDDGLGDDESQSCTARLCHYRAPAAEETGKQLCLFLGAQSDAAVVNGYLDSALRGSRTDTNLASRRVLDGIRNEVAEHLHQPPAISRDPG
jgi:hypothetical protein